MSVQALFKRVTPDETGRETNGSCRNLFLDCDESRTASIVDEYAQNNTQWHEDFGTAFQILIEHGYPSGHLVEAGEELPTLIDPVATPSASVTDTTASAFGTDGKASTFSSTSTDAAVIVNATAIPLLLAVFIGMAMVL